MSEKPTSNAMWNVEWIRITHSVNWSPLVNEIIISIETAADSTKETEVRVR